MPVKKMKVLEISFLSDGFNLRGTLHLPALDHPPVVIGSHGLYSNQESPKQIGLARACNALGLAYFRFDHRGCGRSQGEFEQVTSLAARCTDLKMAIETLKNRFGIGHRIGLFGSSMGGTVCLSVASQYKINTLVTFAAPLRSRIDGEKPGRLKDPDTPEILLDDKKKGFDLTEHLAPLSNILIIHGEKDQTVPLSHAEEIHRLAGDPKKLIVQKNGDHRMSNENHQVEFIREASQWFKSGLFNSFNLESLVANPPK